MGDVVASRRQAVPGKLTTALLFRHTNCFAAMLDSDAVRCFRRETRRFITNL